MNDEMKYRIDIDSMRQDSMSRSDGAGTRAGMANSLEKPKDGKQGPIAHAANRVADQSNDLENSIFLIRRLSDRLLGEVPTTETEEVKHSHGDGEVSLLHYRLNCHEDLLSELQRALSRLEEDL